MNKWDRRLLELAAHIANWSKDPSTKVGAVLVRPDNTIISLGYNGFPRGVADTSDRYLDRAVKYEMVVHAELNAILTAHGETQGTKLYVSPMFPCPQCAAAIVQAGIAEVIAQVLPRPEWVDRWKSARIVLEEGGVKLRGIIDVNVGD